MKANYLQSIENTVKHWYVPGLIGLFFILLGGYLLMVPEAGYSALTTLFSISFIISGIMDILFSLQNKDQLDGWGWHLTGGILNLIIGLGLISHPQVSAVALPFFIGFGLLFRSIQGLGFAFEMKKYGDLHWGNVALMSVLGILAATVLMVHPLFAGLSIIILTAIAFLAAGASALSLSLQLRKLYKNREQISEDIKNKLIQLREDYEKEARSIVS